MNEIKIENRKVYLDKWLVGTVYKTISGRFLFSADVDYCSPLEPKHLREIADRLDEMTKNNLNHKI